jgi:hypothetical protein
MVSAAAVAASPARASVEVCMAGVFGNVTSRSSFHWHFQFEPVIVIQSFKFAAQVEMPRRGKSSSFSSEPSDSSNQAIAATVWLTPPSNLEFPVFLSAHAPTVGLCLGEQQQSRADFLGSRELCIILRVAACRYWMPRAATSSGVKSGIAFPATPGPFHEPGRHCFSNSKHCCTDFITCLLAEQLGCWAMQWSAKGKTGTKTSRT